MEDFARTDGNVRELLVALTQTEAFLTQPLTNPDERHLQILRQSPDVLKRRGGVAIALPVLEIMTRTPARAPPVARDLASSPSTTGRPVLSKWTPAGTERTSC
jgi:hypothetical protein